MALLQKSGTINFLKQSTFFNVVPEKAERNSLNVSDQIAVRAFIQGAENAELHPCGVFSGATRVEDLFFAVRTFFTERRRADRGAILQSPDSDLKAPYRHKIYKAPFMAGFEPATRRFQGLLLYHLATNYLLLVPFSANRNVGLLLPKTAIRQNISRCIE